MQIDNHSGQEDTMENSNAISSSTAVLGLSNQISSSEQQLLQIHVCDSLRSPHSYAINWQTCCSFMGHVCKAMMTLQFLCEEIETVVVVAACVPSSFSLFLQPPPSPISLLMVSKNVFVMQKIVPIALKISLTFQLHLMDCCYMPV